MSLPQRFLKKLNGNISKYRKKREIRQKSFLEKKILWGSERARIKRISHDTSIETDTPIKKRDLND